MNRRHFILSIISYLLVAAAGCAKAPDETTHDEHKQLWTCGMHPQVIQDKPGKCPICHMDLVPLTTKSNHSDHTVQIDPALTQQMGLRTTTAKQGKLVRSIRLFGTLSEAQPNIFDVNLKVNGWIEHLYANTEGQMVHAGEPLFDLYSPEISVALQELISAQRNGALNSTVFTAASQKLRLMGLQPQQIETLAKRTTAPSTVAILSPRTAHITEKPIVEGSAVKAGDTILRLVDHSTLWLDAFVYEQDLPSVKVGETLSAALSLFPGKEFSGEIAFIHPHVEEMTRTVMVRIAVKNPDLLLRPGMYAVATLKTIPDHESILIPREAVIDSGTRAIVFKVAGSERFLPQEVTLGQQGDDDTVEILSGLADNDEIVSSGQFLLDSESRLQEAIKKFQSKGPMHQH